MLETRIPQVSSDQRLKTSLSSGSGKAPKSQDSSESIAECTFDSNLSSTDGYNTEEDNGCSQISLSAKSMSSIATTIESVNGTDDFNSIKSTHFVHASSSSSSSSSPSPLHSPVAASISHNINTSESHSHHNSHPNTPPSQGRAGEGTKEASLMSTSALKTTATSPMSPIESVHRHSFTTSESEIDEDDYFDARSPSAASTNIDVNNAINLDNIDYDGNHSSDADVTVRSFGLQPGMTPTVPSYFDNYQGPGVFSKSSSNPRIVSRAPDDADTEDFTDIQTINGNDKFGTDHHVVVLRESSSTGTPSTSPRPISSISSSPSLASQHGDNLHPATSAASGKNSASITEQTGKLNLPLLETRPVNATIDSALSVDQKAFSHLAPLRTSSTHSVSSFGRQPAPTSMKAPHTSVSTQGSAAYRGSISSVQSQHTDPEPRNSISSFHRPSFSFSSRRKTSPALNYQPPPATTSAVSAAELAKIREAIAAQREAKRKRREFLEDEKVLVGTKVAEGHANFVTAYNMLTGIRVAVSRCNAKNDRELNDEDFTAAHKLAFDLSGNELTPSAKYDFKFKDYSPWVFRHLRELFKLDPADYLMSLTSKYIVSELGSPGKSGSFFYFSRDFRFIIKTIHHNEHKMLRKVLKDYYNHVKNNPDTLISQFYGLHRVKLPFGRKIHFIVMNNLFPPHRDIHRTYDLKGSTLGREFIDQSLTGGEIKRSVVYKDINWIHDNEQIKLGPVKRERFLKQLETDVQLLKRLNVMDYSLLIGIHDLRKGNSENIRDNTLSVFEPGGLDSTKVVELRKALEATSPTALKEFDLVLGEYDREGFTFYSDSGGYRATDEDNQPLNEIYYMGVIDYLTPYTFVKKVETFWKGLSHPRSSISAIPAADYGDRFLKFIKSIVRVNGSNSSSPTSQKKLLSDGHTQHSTEPSQAQEDQAANKAEHLPRLVEVE